MIDAFLSQVTLKSRLAKEIHVRLGNKLGGKWEKQIREGVNYLPWKLFYTNESSLPLVKTKSFESRIFSSKHVSELIHEKFKEFQGSSPYQNFRPVGIDTNSNQSPPILARFSKNELELYVDAIGGPSETVFDGFEKDSRLQLDHIMASGCIMRSLIPFIKSVSSPFVLWDPFCGNGILQLMSASIVAGLPVGSPNVPYAFRSFPIHDPLIYGGIVDSLRLSPLFDNSESITFLGTDASIEAVSICKRNLERFKAQLPSLSCGASAVPFSLTFERVVDAYTVPKSGKIFIMTALPVKGDTEKKYKHFHKMVEQLAKENRLLGCLVITSKWNQFRKHSRRDWLTELKFFVNNREVELLRIVL